MSRDSLRAGWSLAIGIRVMESKATFKYVRKGPRKVRRVVDLVRGKDVQAALDLLKFDKRSQARDVEKLIRSALANASTKGGVRVDTLYVKSIMVHQGPILKRWMPRARGAASPIHKKMSHMTVTLDERI